MKVYFPSKRKAGGVVSPEGPFTRSPLASGMPTLDSIQAVEA